MSKYCYNYESGDYERIEKDGYSVDRGEYIYNWDDSEYRREEEERRREEEEREEERRREEEEREEERRREEEERSWNDDDSFW